MANKAKKKQVAKKKTQTKAKAVVKSKSKLKTKTPKKSKVIAKQKAKATAKINSKSFSKKPVAKVAVKNSAQVKKNVDYSKAITPLGDRLVVRLVQSERITAGGLIIPDSVSQASGYLKATVLAVGTGTKSKKGTLKPMDVKTGDCVLFSEYAGTKIQFNSEDLQIIKESDVMGIVQN